MNERIDKLIEQCTRQNFSDCVGGFETFDKEKFAELIVKECLEQIDKIRDGCEADNEDQQALGADWAGLAVSRHFGVEE
jgi:hypothetical protein